MRIVFSAMNPRRALVKAASNLASQQQVSLLCEKRDTIPLLNLKASTYEIWLLGSKEGRV